MGGSSSENKRVNKSEGSPVVIQLEEIRNNGEKQQWNIRLRGEKNPSPKEKTTTSRGGGGEGER